MTNLPITGVFCAAVTPVGDDYAPDHPAFIEHSRYLLDEGCDGLAMLGTTGTFVGTTRRLKELNPKIRCISLQPDSAFHGIEGAKHLPSAIVPRIYDPSLADENLEIVTEDAHAMARRLVRELGLLVGVSAAAAIVGSLQVAERLKKDQRATIVTILCDSGEKYLSERFWHEE